MEWLEHVARWKDCTACPLYAQRFRICLARGQVPCDVLFVGEAPGASEDAIGQPFVGPAGDLLQQIIDRAVPQGVPYALTNLVCCFPREAKERGDNEPEIEEIKACRPRLYEFIDLCTPKLIVCVGRLASDWIGHDAYGRVRGADVIDITHPAAILRMPMVKKQYAVNHSIVTIRNAIDGIMEKQE